MARETGLEPAASAVTGRRSNQLSYSRNPFDGRGTYSNASGGHRITCKLGRSQASPIRSRRANVVASQDIAGPVAMAKAVSSEP